MSEPIILKGHETRSRQGTAPWAIFAAGFAFVGFSVPMFLVVLDVIHYEPDKIHVPLGFVTWFGVLFAGFGTCVSGRAALGLAAKSKLKAIAAGRPGQPWLADFAWNPAGASDSDRGRLAKAVFGGIAWFSIIGPVWWIFNFYATSKAWWVMPTMSFMLGVGVFIFLYAIYVALRMHKYGIRRLKFARFPFFLGEQLEVTLSGSRPVWGIRQMLVTLRCIRERYIVHGRGKNARTETICEQLYAESKPWLLDEPDWLGQPVAVAFALPSADAVSQTNLAADPALYWELEFKADTPGIDFKAVFLVPVYAKSEP